MRRLCPLILLLPVCFAVTSARVNAEGRSSREEEQADSSTPPRLTKLLETSGLAKSHRLAFDAVNPFYLAGEFDGDKKEDFACWVRRKDAPQHSTPDLVVLRGSGQVQYPRRDAGPNFPSGDAWYVVHPGMEVPSRPEHNPGKSVPSLKTDAFIMMKLGSAAGLVFWDGGRFDVYWTAD